MEVSGRRLLTTLPMCEPCQTENISKQSDGFCTDCQEYMCETCFQHHLKAKSCRNHVLDTFNGGSSDRGLQMQEAKCKKHTKETIKYYCGSHDSVACGDCLVSEHSKCEPKFIRDVATNFEESSEFKNVQNNMSRLETDKAQGEMRIERDRKENKVILDNALQSLQNSREEINVWLDKMEKNIETELKKIADDNEALMSEMEKNLKDVSDDIDKIKEKMNTNLYQGESLFINMVECKPMIGVIDAFFSDVKSNKQISPYTFEPQITVDEMSTSPLRLGVLKISSMTNKDNTETVSHDGSSVLNPFSSKGSGHLSDVQRPRTRTKPPVPFAELEASRESVKLTKKMYSGTFGEIYAGKWRGTVDVAIKTTRSGTDCTSDDYLAEAKILHQLRHERIVQLIAVCTKSKPIWIITELMVNGDLLNYLRKDGGKLLQFPQLTVMAGQIASGMAYLEVMNYIHTSLQAASILVGFNNNVKVAHLRTAHLIQGEAFVGGVESKIAIKWTAPEAAVCGKYSIKSDVWSYGVLLHELITFGTEPYPGMTNSEVLKRIEQDYRMPQKTTWPVPCPDPYYEIMLQCWNKVANSRPTFEYLQDFFEHYMVAAEERYDKIF